MFQNNHNKNSIFNVKMFLNTYENHSNKRKNKNTIRNYKKNNKKQNKVDKLLCSMAAAHIRLKSLIRKKVRHEFQ